MGWRLKRNTKIETAQVYIHSTVCTPFVFFSNNKLFKPLFGLPQPFCCIVQKTNKNEYSKSKENQSLQQQQQQQQQQRGSKQSTDAAAAAAAPAASAAAVRHLDVLSAAPNTMQEIQTQHFRFRVQGLGCRIQGLGFQAQGLGFGAQGLLVQGLGLPAQGLGFRVQGLYVLQHFVYCFCWLQFKRADVITTFLFLETKTIQIYK